MKFSKFLFRPMLAATIAIAWAGYTKADTITDTITGVSYTLTSTFVPEEGTNTFDVTLVVDAATFMGKGGAMGGFLQVLAPQFMGASLVTLDSAPGGVAGWSGVGIPGLTNAGGCDFKSAPSGHVCFSNFSLNAAGALPGTLTFIFDVTLPGTTMLNSSSDIQAVFNADSFGGGAFLGQTSMPITIQQGAASVPEPSSLLLLGAGLFGLALCASRRLVTA